MNKKIFSFGKVDYNNTGRRDCPVTIEMGLYDDGRLSMMGTIWNHIKSDCYCGGQCYEELDSILTETKKKFGTFSNEEQYRKLRRVWDLYHLKNVYEIENEEDKNYILDLLKD